MLRVRLDLEIMILLILLVLFLLYIVIVVLTERNGDRSSYMHRVGRKPDDKRAESGISRTRRKFSEC